jgi:uncharacterized repeat protein (TIGR01451 family)
VRSWLIKLRSSQLCRVSALRQTAAGLVALAVYGGANAHSVGQVQTTKFLSPQTITLLQNRVAAGQPAGFQAGDVLTYIIQFTPVRNNANTGVAGYITDYIPPGTEVVGASFVSKDAAGNYFNISPALPGGIDSGWGNRGQKTFLAPFNTNTYDPTGRCAAAGFGANCNARLTELHADTGIFYSTDSRTAVFPALPTRIAQGTNGYNIQPTAANQLNPIIGQTNATTHNLWDASQTNAFGSGSQAIVDGIAAPKSSALYLGNAGTGATPYLAGSAVAGPQTGYALDNTGAVGPWQRIAYPGSRIGDPTTGPATAPDISFTAIGGLPTSAGVSLSTSNPLPAGTNAVRWAAGKLQVGEIKYVSISLRLTAAPALSGIQNQSEVFGGDAGDGDNGQDNVWRYHVPSVADNNSNLYIYKTPCQYDASASNCVPLIGSAYPANSTVTYQISYLNTGAQPQTNVVLSDVLPCYTANGALIRVGFESGPLPLTTPFTTTTALAGNCGTSPPTRYTVTFPTIASLAPGDGGSLVINVPNSAGTLGNVVVNTARLTSTDLPGGVTSNAVTTVGNNTLPALALNKVTTTPATTPGGTAQYVVTLQNYGTGPATGIQLDDFLPTNGGAVDATRRFNFASLVNYTSSGLTTNTALATATTTASVTTTSVTTLLEPYDTDAGATNRVRVNFNFGAASSLAAGGVVTLTFNVTVGTNMALSPPSYTNDIVARTTAGTLVRVDTNNAAPISVALLANLAITKTNGTDTLIAGQTTSYTVVASNGGPSSASGALLRDPISAGLSCTQIICIPSGATCPAPLDIATLQGAGLVVPSFPPNTSLTLQLTCGVTATGVP